MRRAPARHGDGTDIGPHAGLDEAGRGCLAGPVMAAAVMLPAVYDLPGLTDSKKLSPGRRDILAAAIKAQAETWAIGVVWPAEIDRINILAASLLAMAKALRRLSPIPPLVFIDGNQTIPARNLTRFAAPPVQRAVVGGDLLVPAISAASILAKTIRDRLMTKLDARFPGYGLAQHKGYGTAVHLAALARLGPSPIHRLTFARVRPPDQGRLL
ncbi:MAG: ribonuclease HII [Desulfovibrionaceae bacterium]|nr:ribonuclease HII [Desulfovibrionaceae bacterium]